MSAEISEDTLNEALSKYTELRSSFDTESNRLSDALRQVSDNYSYQRTRAQYGDSIINDSKITINSIKELNMTNQEAYTNYENACKAKADSIEIGLSTLAGMISSAASPQVGIIIGFASTYIINIDDGINTNYHSALGGTYYSADITYKADYDFAGIPKGSGHNGDKITFNGTVLVGPDINGISNPLNNVDWY